MAASDIVLSDEVGPSASVADLDLDAVRSLVQREIGVNLTVGELRGGDELQELQAEGGLGEKLLTAGSAPEVLELVTARDPTELTVDDVAAACRRIALRAGTITDAMVEDWRFPRFMRSARTVIGRSDLAPHHVATLLWAVAVLRESLPEFQDFLPEICTQVPEVAPEMNVQNLTSCFSSAAKLRQRAPEVLDTVDPLLDEIMGEASVVDAAQLSSIIWAAGELELPDDQIYALTGALLRDLSPERLRRFKSRELTNLVWGLANLGERDAGLLQAVADIVGASVAKMPPKEANLDLPMLVCGFQRLMFRDEAFLQTVAQRLLKKKILRKMNNWGVCALAWAWPDYGDDIQVGDLRSVREVINAQLTRRKLRSVDVERSIKGPSRWMDEQ